MRLPWVVMVLVAGCFFGSKKPDPNGAIRVGDGGPPPARRDAITVGPAHKLSPPPGQWGGNYPDAAAAGERVAVVWLHSRTPTDACVVATWLGTKRTDLIEVGCGSINGAPVIAAGGNAPLIVWSDTAGIVGARLGERDAKRVFTQAPSSGTRKIAVGWDGERYIVAWSDQRAIYGLLVAGDGTPLGAPQKLATSYPSSGFLQRLQMWCTPGVCTLAYSGTDGYNKPTYATLAIERGVPKTWGGSDPPSKLRLPRLFASRWYTEPTLEGIEPDRNMLVGLETGHGSVVAWEHERTVRVAYIPADPDLRRLAPLVYDGYDPVIVARGNSRFVLVMVSRDQYVEARTIDIDSLRLAAQPAKRPPAMTGLVLDTTGQPVAHAAVELQLLYAGGAESHISTGTGDDGTFTLKHPHERELEHTYDVAAASGWAYRGDHVSAIQSGTNLTLRLQEPAQLSVKIAGASTELSIDVHVYSPDSTSSYHHEIWSKQLSARSSFEIAAIPAGKLELTATAPGITARASATLRPGKRTTVVVNVPAPPAAPVELAK